MNAITFFSYLREFGIATALTAHVRTLERHLNG